MTPAQAISALDRQIEQRGQTLHLRDAKDLVGAGKRVRGTVRGYRPDELAGGVQQGDSAVIISPTSLAAVSVSLERSMKLQIGDRWTSILAANPVRMNDTIVRWNVWVRG